MKMGILFSAVLWGSFFVLLGLSVILKHTLNIDIPVARIFLGVFLVFLGVRILSGGRPCGPKKECGTLFAGGKVLPDAKTGEYNIFFGDGLVDLSGLQPGTGASPVKTNAIFGAATVKLKAGVPARIKANSAFASIRLPNGNTSAFGTAYYQTPSYKEGQPCLDLEVNAVFGDAKILEE